MTAPLTRAAVFLSAAFLWTGCQQKPTQTSTQLPVMIDSKSEPAKVKKNIEQVLAEHPVILDARSPFDFNLGHVPQAINLRWEDFSQQDPHSRGVLDSDTFSLARRLSLIGIDPDTSVVVIGKGLQGAGEEGRVAWTLQVLGIKKVYLLHHAELRALRNQDSPAVQNKAYWKPEIDETLTVDFSLFKNMVTGQIPSRAPPTKARAKALGVPAHVAMQITTANLFGMPMDVALTKLVVLDARSPSDFSIESLKTKKDIKVPVVNLEWKEFFDEKGFVSPKVEEKLTALGISKDSILFVISNHGVRSAATVYALRSLGYNRSSNFSGGYEQWNVKK